MLKFCLRKERLNFTKGWEASESEATSPDPDDLEEVNLLSRVLGDGDDAVVARAVELLVADA